MLLLLLQALYLSRQHECFLKSTSQRTGFLKALASLWQSVVRLGAFENPAQIGLLDSFWKMPSLFHRFDCGPKLIMWGPTKIQFGSGQVTGLTSVKHHGGSERNLCKHFHAKSRTQTPDMAPVESKNGFLLIQAWSLFQVHRSIWYQQNSTSFYLNKGFQDLAWVNNTANWRLFSKIYYFKAKMICGNISASRDALFTGLPRGPWQLSLP